jgi:predicted oxidoreductase
LPIEKNVDDDVAQPIIIKKSSKPFENSNFHSMPVALLKEPIKNSRTTKQQTISTVKRPQLTNYALNEGSNLGVKLGFHPTLFS